MLISCPGPVPVRGYTPLFFKLSDRVIDSKKDLVNVSFVQKKVAHLISADFQKVPRHRSNPKAKNIQAVLNIHLPAARSPEETHAQIQVLQNPFALYHQLVHAVSLTKDVQVYFVTIDKKSKSVSLSHAKDNKVLFVLQ